MKKIIYIIIIFCFIIFNCKSQDDITKIQDFKKFTKVFEQAIKNKDKETLKKIIWENFYYQVDQLQFIEGEEGIEKLDFELINKIIQSGYEEYLKNKSGNSPPSGMQKKYSKVVFFINRGNGWRLKNIVVMTGGAM